MNEQLKFDLPPLTPIERLIDDHRTAFRLRHYEQLTLWEIEAKADIARRVESANRSIGQLFRHAAARLARAFS